MARGIWIEPGAQPDLCRGRPGGALSRRQLRAETRCPYISGIRHRLPRHCRHLPAAHRTGMAVAVILVLRQDGLDSVRLHLGPRHVAAVPLRPTDGFHLEVPVPGSHAESAGDRTPGRLDIVMPITPDVILFMVFALIAVVSAINVVVQTHPISSALSLVGVMGSLAIL